MAAPSASDGAATRICIQLDPSRAPVSLISRQSPEHDLHWVLIAEMGFVESTLGRPTGLTEITPNHAVPRLLKTYLTRQIEPQA